MVYFINNRIPTNTTFTILISIDFSSHVVSNVSTIQYAFKYLEVHQLFANISEGNDRSMQLFESIGFKNNGCKKDWIASEEGFKNEFIYQLIHHVH